MDRNESNQSPPVPEKAKQGGEAPAPSWDWVEDSVWTERMLATLNKGIKGGKWYSLKRWPNVYFVTAGLHILRTDPQLKLPIQNMAF